MAYNVGVLAENMESRLALVCQDLEDIAEQVDHLGLKVEMGEERQARKQIRRLTVKKEANMMDLVG